MTTTLTNTTSTRPSPARMAERFAAVAAPSGLAIYGVCRFVDGLDGAHEPGFAWNVGHGFFLAAMLAFALFAISVARRVGGRCAVGAAAAAVTGVVAFTWVILGDLSTTVADALPVPDPVMMVGPLLLVVGLVPLFALAPTLRGRN